MDTLSNIYRDLHQLADSLIRRQLMDEIDWNDRLICIKGFKGSGKTSFLLQYARDNYSSNDRRCLYINLNNLHFSVHSILDFAKEFHERGGEVLLIDQPFKYPDWARELVACYEKCPDLRIVFTAPAAWQPDREEFHRLNEILKSYYLPGFSFREFIELKTGQTYSSCSLDEIRLHHEEIVNEIVKTIHPLAYLDEYFRRGFFPFHLQQGVFSEIFSDNTNAMLEIDVLTINQIDPTYLPRIRKLLYLLSQSSPSKPNISQLSLEIDTSRATVMHYIKILNDSRLLNLLYRVGEKYPKKPDLIYAHNSSLLHATHPRDMDNQTLCETFFFNQLNLKHQINLGERGYQFLIDEEHKFSVGSRIRGKFNPDVYYAISGIERGEKNVIPLWLFGFLY